MRSLPISSSTHNRKMPPAVFVIYFVQLFSTCSFAVMFASLVLYMRQKLGMTSHEANTLTGIYFAYNFSLHLLAGFLGGRLFSYRTLISGGLLFQLVGCLLLANGHLSYLYWGLTSMLIGTGTLVTCVNMTISQLFEPTDPRRETAFLWNYSGMNIGFLLGFTLSGFFQLTANYRVLFFSSSTINLLAALCLFIGWRCVQDKKTIYMAKSISKKRQGRCFGIGIIVLLVIVLHFLLRHAVLSQVILLSAGTLMYLWIFRQIRLHTGEMRRRLISYLILLLAALMFFVVYQLAPMGVMLFAQYNVDRHVLGFLIAPGWIQNINAVAIILGGPLLAVLFKRLRRQGKRVTAGHQFALGLLISGFGLLLLPTGILFSSMLGYVAFAWLFFYAVFQAIAELCISPVGYSMVGQLIPRRLQSIFMGVNLLNTGIAAILASYLSNLAVGNTASHNPLVTNSSYESVFISLAIVMFLFSLVLFLLLPLLKAWMPKLDLSPEETVSLES